MVLRIETFNNATGGNTLYKALTHPSAAGPAQELLRALADNSPVAICDPSGAIEPFAELFGLDGIEIAGIYVQRIERLGSCILGRPAAPISELAVSNARSVFVAAFDAESVDCSPSAFSSRGRADFQPRCDAPAGRAADQPPHLSRSAQFRDQFRVLPR